MKQNKFILLLASAVDIYLMHAAYQHIVNNTYRSSSFVIVTVAILVLSGVIFKLIKEEL